MKRITSLLISIILILTSFATCFAESLDDSGMTAFAKVEFNDGIAASYPDLGAVLFEKDGVVSILAKGFDYPTGLAVDANGNLYVSDTGSNRVCKITPSGKLSSYKTGLHNPTGLCFDGDTMYICDTGSNRIMKVQGYSMTPYAGVLRSYGDGEYEGGYVEGALDIAEFDHPQGIVASTDGAIYIADTNNAAIRKIKDNKVSTVYVNRDSSGDIVKPGHIWLDGDTLYINDLYSEETLTLSVAPKQFEDVPETAWYLEGLNQAVEYLLIEGDDDTHFAPNRNLSRAETITIIAKAYLYCNPNAVLGGDSVFTDVAEGSWYESNINWAAASGITCTTGGAINPNESITREELVMMLYNYANFTGNDTSINTDAAASESDSPLAVFSDSSLISDEAIEAFTWAVNKGLIAGYPDGTLGPQKSLRRCEAVTIFLRLM